MMRYLDLDRSLEESEMDNATPKNFGEGQTTCIRLDRLERQPQRIVKILFEY